MLGADRGPAGLQSGDEPGGGNVVVRRWGRVGDRGSSHRVTSAGSAVDSRLPVRSAS
ncbi:WGR domain-containing protein [Micromonospora radicis]|uniref:WGR domain-containing protein n=1 Tax=Micromonospora radicis TaxID=1894971 RepID=A0A418MMK0_9ACTN|nr:WGR domain-containing protein [Micromonospora radicis]